MNIYERLKGLREDRDLKQSEVAELINTTQSYYAQYENGKRQIPFERMIELSKIFNVSLDYLACQTNDKRGLTRSELSDEETDIIKKFRSLNEKRKGRLIGQLDFLTDEQIEETAHIRQAR